MRSLPANHQIFIRMKHYFFRSVLALITTFICIGSASATTMQLALGGIGQVLIFPYYTARNGTVSIVSIVNTTVSAKAVRINVREARGGFVVAQLNVYMSAKDVWTGAIFNDADGATLVSNDKSCTAPALGSGLQLTNTQYLADLPTIGADLGALGSRDRSREGYVEVIEMASIPNQSVTGKNITHVAGVPACREVTDANYSPPVADLTAPSGGLYGTLSLVNVNQGMLASTPATAIENFWLTGTDAPTPRVAAANAVGVDLTSGKNTGVSLIVRGEPYVARFATSIDAVSALLMSTDANGEYATTQDGVIQTLVVATMPTKPYYTRGATLGPFEKAWEPAGAKSCDSFNVAAIDREEFVSAVNDDFGLPPRPQIGNCYVANPMVPRDFISNRAPIADNSYFGSTLAVSVTASQNQGLQVRSPGKEGGWSAISWIGKLSAVDASVMRRNAAGELAATPVSITLNGLPVLGFTLAQSAYKTGSPQQNFADATALRTSVTVTEGK